MVKMHFTEVGKVMMMMMIMVMRIIMKIWKQSLEDVLQNRFSSKFRKFHRKTRVLEFLFNKFFNFIKNRFQHSCFPMKFTNFLRTPFSTEHLLWLLLKIMSSSSYLSVLPIVAKNSFISSSTTTN